MTGWMVNCCVFVCKKPVCNVLQGPLRHFMSISRVFVNLSLITTVQHYIENCWQKPWGSQFTL